MGPDPIEFAWFRAREGHSFHWARHQLGTDEIWSLEAPHSEAMVRYRPLVDAPELLHAFAAVEPSREGILAFANRYGRMGSAADMTDPRVNEAYDRWVALNRWTRRLLKIWDACRRGDLATLRGHFHGEPDADGGPPFCSARPTRSPARPGRAGRLRRCPT
jgi:hypothetical protein